jgi:SPP1 family predicted phage head-tail adaptor
MKAGELRHKVTIVTPTADGTEDEYGHSVPNTESVNVWAAELPQSSREYYRASQIQGDLSTLLRMRWRDDISRTSVVTIGSRVLNVLGTMNPDGRRIELLVMCKEAT